MRKRIKKYKYWKTDKNFYLQMIRLLTWKTPKSKGKTTYSCQLKNKYKNKIVLLYAGKNQLEITKGKSHS